MLTCPHCGAGQRHEVKPGCKTDCRACFKPFMAPGTKAAPKKKDEADIQTAIIKSLVEKGWLTVRVNSGSAKRGKATVHMYHTYGLLKVPQDQRPKTNAGFPDVLAMKGGRTLLLEVKTPTGCDEVDQPKFRAFALLHGVTVHIVRSVEEVDAILNSAS